MNWQETVMNPFQMSGAVINHPDLPMGRAIAETQAEISFKAGIQKVVEWLERTKKIKVPKYQLEEWGI